MKFRWLLFVLVASQLSDAYKILVVFPLLGKSHSILGNGVVKYLLDAGHEVTYVTPFQWKDSPPRLQLIDVSDNVDVKFMDSLLNITSILNKEVSINPVMMFNFINSVCAKTIENVNFAKLLGNVNQKFDVVIAEWMFTSVYTGLGAVFNCPFIWVSTIEPHWMVLKLIDENPNPAYVPDAMSNNLPPFTFTERVQELLVMLIGGAAQTLFTNNYEKKEYERLLGPYITQRGRQVPSFDEVRYNASLMLGNSHVSFGLANKLPQNYKPIGGYHIDREVKPLPTDLKKLLDGANNGAIYFSMGSNLKGKDLPDVLKKGLVNIFSKLKQTVIWKFEEVLPDLPKNVHIVDWAPQQSILAHPNCILFITHGGLLSTTETIHFGKPIIGIPVFGDQYNNIDRAVKKGYAIRVDLSYDMFDDLEKAIKDILNNPSYTEKAKELSVVYNDRPVPPGVELVHWVEHVVRTRGAPHLRSPALDMPFYQKMYLDLAALILAIICILKMTIKRLCCSSKKVDKKKKTN